MERHFLAHAELTWASAGEYCALIRGRRALDTTAGPSLRHFDRPGDRTKLPEFYTNPGTLPGLRGENENLCLSPIVRSVFESLRSAVGGRHGSPSRLKRRERSELRPTTYRASPTNSNEVPAQEGGPGPKSSSGPDSHPGSPREPIRAARMAPAERVERKSLSGVASHDEHPAILIVENEVLVRLLGVSTFADAGFRVIEANSADDAFGLLEADS
jgi:hypothetical protein